MLKQAIILAGGFGTRLQSVIFDIPKPMAPVNNIPFLEYLFNYLKHYNITDVVLSVGYKSECIENHFGYQFSGIKIQYAYENSPLGTGGGIVNALKYCDLNEKILILNGDTLFQVDLNSFYSFCCQSKSEFCIASRPVNETDRYGSISLNDNFQIIGFTEKQQSSGKGYINGGIYLFTPSLLLSFDLPEVFSIEKDFFELNYSNLNLFAFISDTYFIDIGIPEDYERAQYEFKELSF